MRDSWRLSLATTLSALSCITQIWAWPDGAPCIHAAYESMNPLEAVEHQGGLRLSPPPYEIYVSQKCYWPNQPIALAIQGVNQTVKFKGFVIQPFEWNNDILGNRIGQLVRLDDNGSWQQQCFRFKNSATHSHDEPKKKINMWWKTEDDTKTVQFVATVVRHQTEFWVRSVRSAPLPPCSQNRRGFPNYVPPLPTVPPPVKAFKMETHRLWASNLAPLNIVSQESILVRPRTKLGPTGVTAPMNRIIPVPDDFNNQRTTALVTQRPTFQQTFATNPAPSPQFQTRPQPQFTFAVTEQPFNVQPQLFQQNLFPAQPQPVTSAPEILTTRLTGRNRLLNINRRILRPRPFNQNSNIIELGASTNNVNFAPQNQANQRQLITQQPQPSFIQSQLQQQQQQQSFTMQNRFVQQPPFAVNNQFTACQDRDPLNRCLAWRSYCRDPNYSNYISQFCARTCGYCQ